MRISLRPSLRAAALGALLGGGAAATPSAGTPTADAAGRGWRDAAICMGCASAVIAASGTGSIIAIGEVLAAVPELGAACVYSCVNWNS